VTDAAIMKHSVVLAPVIVMWDAMARLLADRRYLPREPGCSNIMSASLVSFILVTEADWSIHDLALAACIDHLRCYR
jgi:hypothetical protein